jgi:hypothetical protein
MRESIKVAQKSSEAASRSADAASQSAQAAKTIADFSVKQRREELEREVNRSAQSVIASAARMQELAKTVPTAWQSLYILSGMGVPSTMEAHHRKREFREQAAAKMMTDAGIILGTLQGGPPDAELTAALKQLDGLQVQLDLMKVEVTEELNGVASESRFRRQQNEARMQSAGGRIPPSLPPAT